MRIRRFDQGGTDVPVIQHCFLLASPPRLLRAWPATFEPIRSTRSRILRCQPERASLSGQTTIDPTGNYLTALSASQQAAFQAGSFDVPSHPATASETAALMPTTRSCQEPSRLVMFRWLRPTISAITPEPRSSNPSPGADGATWFATRQCRTLRNRVVPRGARRVPVICPP